MVLSLQLQKMALSTPYHDGSYRTPPHACTHAAVRKCQMQSKHAAWPEGSEKAKQSIKRYFRALQGTRAFTGICCARRAGTRRSRTSGCGTSAAITGRAAATPSWQHVRATPVFAYPALMCQTVLPAKRRGQLAPAWQRPAPAPAQVLRCQTLGRTSPVCMQRHS